MNTFILGLIVGCTALAPGAASQPKHVLYFTHSASYAHAIIPYSVDVMKRWAAQDGGYTLDCTDDCGVITPENLARYDVLVFYTNRELPISEPNRRAILDFVRNGKGFVAIHSGTGTFFEWTPYQEMINAIFDGHPWNQKVRVTVQDTKHPIMRGVPKSVEIEDEIYQHTNWVRSRTHVLATLDLSSVDMKAPGVHRTDRDFALAWAHRYGHGRVYVNALGHTKAVWDALWFEKMIVQGIHWAAKELPRWLPAQAVTDVEPR